MGKFERVGAHSTETPKQSKFIKLNVGSRRARSIFPGTYWSWYDRPVADGNWWGEQRLRSCHFAPGTTSRSDIDHISRPFFLAKSHGLWRRTHIGSQPGPKLSQYKPRAAFIPSPFFPFSSFVPLPLPTVSAARNSSTLFTWGFEACFHARDVISVCLKSPENRVPEKIALSSSLG